MPPTPSDPPRFTLADILKLTAFVAVVLGAGSWLLPREPFRFIFSIVGLNLVVGFLIAGVVWCLQSLFGLGAKNPRRPQAGSPITPISPLMTRRGVRRQC